MKQRFSILIVIAGICLATAGCAGNTSKPAPEFHKTTVWDVQPSFKYDMFCFMNILTGDPFYTRFYKKTYAHFEPMLTPEVKSALAAIKKSIKDDGGGIVPARLNLFYSVVPADNLDSLIAATRDVAPLKEALQKTEYFDVESWETFDRIRPQLITVFQFLQQIHFRQYWEAEVRPGLLKAAAANRDWLEQYNIVPLEEGILGRPMTSNVVHVYMLHYVVPHGMRITGTRFLTADVYPKHIVLMTAMHEMLHPPYDWDNDKELREALETLKQDPFLMQRVEHHNPSFGYNSFEGFVEEDVVQASDQLVGEAAGRPLEPGARWRKSDDGMHVLAVALYELAHQEHYNLHAESMRDFIIRMIRSGKLAPGRIEAEYRKLYPAEDKAGA